MLRQSYQKTINIYITGDEIGTLSIDETFNKKLRGELKDFEVSTEKFEKMRQDCEQNYHILTWLYREEIEDYKLGAYNITIGQKKTIDQIIERIDQKRKIGKSIILQLIVLVPLI